MFTTEVSPGVYELPDKRRVYQRDLARTARTLGEHAALSQAAAFGLVDLDSAGADLGFRRVVLGEAEPHPYITVRSLMNGMARASRVKRGLAPLSDDQVIDRLAKVSQPIIMDLRNLARERGKIEQIEDRLRGQNRYATDEQRAAVWVQDRGHCTYCETPVSPFGRARDLDKMHLDHIEAFDGHNTYVENLVCACRMCNLAKVRDNPLEFLKLEVGEIQDRYFDRMQAAAEAGRYL